MVKGAEHLNLSACTVWGPKEVNQTKKKQREAGRDDGGHRFGWWFYSLAQTTLFFPRSPGSGQCVLHTHFGLEIHVSNLRFAHKVMRYFLVAYRKTDFCMVKKAMAQLSSKIV